MSDTEKGETEEEYLARVRNVPGIFGDRNQPASDVVDSIENQKKDAEALYGQHPDAPNPNVVDDKGKEVEVEDIEPVDPVLSVPTVESNAAEDDNKDEKSDDSKPKAKAKTSTKKDS